MSELGAKVEAEILSRLGGLIQEEELHAMVDAAIPRARDELQKKVTKGVVDVFEGRLRPFFDSYVLTPDFDKQAQKIADMLTERLIGAYEEEAGLRVRNVESPYSGGASYNRLYRLWDVVEQGFVEKLVAKVREKVEHWRHTNELDKQADQIVAKMFPQVAAAWLENGALRMFNTLAGLLHQQKEAMVDLQTVADAKGSCPSCRIDFVTCPGCKKLVSKNSYCCGADRV